MTPLLRDIVTAFVILAIPGAASAVSFTVAPGAVGGPGAACALGPADVCNSPKNGANANYALAAVLGLAAGDVVDALSFNLAPPPPPFPPFGPQSLQFSVAPGAAGPGLPGAVDPGAIYRSAGAGTVLDTASALLGLAPGDVDGYENLNVPVGGPNAIFFSLAPGSPSLVAGGFTPGDIFLVVPAGGAFGLFINAESLGMCTIRSGCPQDDDLNAMVVNTDAWVNVGQPFPTLQVGNGLLFSVAPGAMGPGLPPGVWPGDVLHSLGGGASVPYAGFAALGLAAADNLDALEVFEPHVTPLPKWVLVPVAAAILVGGFVVLRVRGRRP